MKTEHKIKINLSREQLELTKKMRSAVSDLDVKTVSFKLFGTLILTPFSESEDIFLLMNGEFPELSTEKADFARLRTLAEEEAAAKEKNCSPTLSRIYEIIGKKCRTDRAVLDKAMERECRLIEKLCFPRNFGKMLFEEAVSGRKKIIVTADTVYPRDTVSKLLENCGYSGATLLITNELTASDNRDLAVYRKISDKAGCPAAKLLHIGGDVEADVETPMMTDVMLSLNRSGRLCGWLHSELVYGYDTAECLGIHGILGLYGAYVFDIPRQKLPQSDFCGSRYGLGAIVYGSLLLSEDTETSDFQRQLEEAMERDEAMKRGGEEMAALFAAHFGGFAEKMGREGFGLPLKFLEEYGAPVDRQLFGAALSSEDMKSWAKRAAASEAAVVSGKKHKKNVMERLADKMFPPGTKVRSIADNIMIKLKGKSKL